MKQTTNRMPKGGPAVFDVLYTSESGLDQVIKFRDRASLDAFKRWERAVKPFRYPSKKERDTTFKEAYEKARHGEPAYSVFRLDREGRSIDVRVDGRSAARRSAPFSGILGSVLSPGFPIGGSESTAQPQPQREKPPGPPIVAFLVKKAGERIEIRVDGRTAMSLWPPARFGSVLVALVPRGRRKTAKERRAGGGPGSTARARNRLFALPAKPIS